MSDQFYLVLPSNSSMKYYPENTVTHYITQLPKPLKLPGEWVVALTEIQFPRTFFHVDKAVGVSSTATPIKAYSTRRKPTSNHKYKIQSVPITSGLYPSVSALIECINETEVFKNHIRIEYDGTVGGLVDIRRIPSSCVMSECQRPNVIYLDDRLSRTLGFVPGTHMDIHEEVKFTADYPASLSLALPDKLYVYTDICESYITGDVQTPLLRIVPVDNTNYIYGSIQTKSFSPPIYIPLLRTEFNTIEIDIRTDTGKPVPFHSGTLTATLHFKRIR